MIKNYLRVAFRNLLRNFNYTLINVTGLSIGLTSCILIFLLIRYDLSFDKFNSKYDRIYRIVQNSKSGSGVSHNAAIPYPFPEAFRNDFPDVPLLTQIHVEGESLLNINGEKIKINKVIFADSLFSEVFDFHFLSGNPKVDLGQPGKVFFSKSLAYKILKNKKPGSIKLNNKVELEVAGIVEDAPPTSHIQYSIIVSFPSLTSDFLGGLPLNEWGLSSSGFCYVVLPDQVKAATLESRLRDFVTKYHSKEDASRKTYLLQPLKAIHFDTFYTDTAFATVRESDLMMLGVLGLFILIIACINFVNLATALAVKKSKEVGVRKTLGASRRQLTVYFLTDTLIITFLSLIISLGVVEWLLSWLNKFLERNIHVHLISNLSLTFFLLCLVFFVTLLSGFYPAAVLAKFNPVVVLKNKLSSRERSGVSLRRVLVIFQFMVAQVLIIATLIISNQMHYSRDKSLGFDKEAIVTVQMPENKKELLDNFRSRLETNPDITGLSYAVGAPVSDNNVSTGFRLTSNDTQEPFKVSMKLVDRFFMDTYGLNLKAGRWFTESDEKGADMSLPPKDQHFVYVINEAAMHQLGFQNPEEVIGKSITSGLMDISGQVIGVVEDFHMASFHEKIQPLVFMNFPFFYYYAGIKINPKNLSKTIPFIREKWSELYPDYYFEYEFLDEYWAGLYKQDERTFTLFKILSGVAIFIGCLGLYGLISFVANQKVKEIGIRKVMGASVVNIISSFSREFIILIIIAFALAAPLVWYFMNEWLNGFAYHIGISWLVFLIGLTATLVISLLTVGYRSIRAAMANPVDTLRTE